MADETSSRGELSPFIEEFSDDPNDQKENHSPELIRSLTNNLNDQTEELPQKSVEPLTDEKIDEKFSFLCSKTDAYNTSRKQAVLDELLSDRENPKAQIAALTNIIHCNSSIYTNLKDLSKINFVTIQEDLGISTQQCLDTERKIKQLLNRSVILNKQEAGRNNEENQIAIAVNHLLLDAKKGLLNNVAIPDEYKIQVILGLTSPMLSLFELDPALKEDAENCDQEIDDVLSKLYNDLDTSQEVKKTIADVAKTRLTKDLYALDIIPLKDYSELGVDPEKVFLAAISNKYTTSEYVESTLAPLFFPKEDPQKVKAVWECLSKVTAGDIFGEGRFFVNNKNLHPKLFNRIYFKEFLDNADKLTPLLNLITPYGYTYSPTRRDSAGVSAEHESNYVPGLLELTKDIPALQQELEAIKAVYPHFKYEYKTKQEYNPLTKTWENIIDNNPYAIAFEQFASQNHEKSSQTIFNEGMRIFGIVPQRWKDTFIRQLINWSEYKIPGGLGIKQEDAEKIIQTLNQLIIDPAVSERTLTIVGNGYFYNSLKPDARNAEFAYHFLENHPDKVTPFNLPEGISANDQLWFDYVQKVGDIYRYDLSSGDIELKKEMAKKDLSLALKAVEKILDPRLKDLSLENLIYAYTDADYHDLEIATRLTGLISNPIIKENAQEEIRLEQERQDKKLTTVWKKVEKVRRHSEENIRLLVDLLGFTGKEAQEQANHIYHEKSGNFPPAQKIEGTAEECTQALAAETERIHQTVGVTINMSWKNLASLLTLGKVKSIWENLEEMERRNTTMDYHYGSRRDEIERYLGNRAKGGASDPHPIYGALSSPNGRDEFFGAAFPYGECFIKLKNKNIAERTTVTYDDSFNGFSDFPFLWEQAATAKAMMNLTNHETRHGYAEVQILGGVATDDIESISIPKLVLQEVYKNNGQAGVERILDQINKANEQFPGIEIKIIEEASASKMIDLLSTYFHVGEFYLEGMRKYYTEVATHA